MPNQAFIKKLDEIIEANLTNEQFGVSQLASEMGMSRSNLHRRLNSITQTSVSQYIRQVRLKQATDLFQDGSLTVSEVAFRVGFGSVTYFSKCFRDYYGFTPGTAVKNNLFELDNTDNTDIAVDTDNIDNADNSDPPDNVDNADIANDTEQFIFGNCTICGKPVQETSSLNEQIIEVKPNLKGKRLRIGLYLILLFIIISTAFLYNSFSPFSSSHKSNEKTIAVLPFVDNSPEGGNTYIMKGINEEIRIKLDKIENLNVKSPTVVEKYRDSNLSLSDIAKDLNVHYILSGSGEKIQDTMRIRFQLIDVDSGNELWSKPYQEEVNDKNIFKIQEELAFAVANELKLVIDNPEKSN